MLNAPTRGRSRVTRASGDRGSILMLMPAAILIVLVLGAIAVDMSVIYLAKHELIDAASAAANDAATVGLNEASLRVGSGYSLDPTRIDEAVGRSLASSGILGRLAEPPMVTITSTDQVRVDLTIEVDYIFAKALPGNRGHTTVHASATANAQRN